MAILMSSAPLEAQLETLERYIPACEERLQIAQRRLQKQTGRYQTEWGLFGISRGNHEFQPTTPPHLGISSIKRPDAA